MWERRKRKRRRMGLRHTLLDFKCSVVEKGRVEKEKRDELKERRRRKRRGVCHPRVGFECSHPWQPSVSSLRSTLHCFNCVTKYYSYQTFYCLILCNQATNCFLDICVCQYGSTCVSRNAPLPLCLVPNWCKISNFSGTLLWCHPPKNLPKHAKILLGASSKHFLCWRTTSLRRIPLCLKERIFIVTLVAISSYNAASDRIQ